MCGLVDYRENWTCYTFLTMLRYRTVGGTLVLYGCQFPGTSPDHPGISPAGRERYQKKSGISPPLLCPRPPDGDIPGRRGHPGPRWGYPRPLGDIPGRVSGMSSTSGDIPGLWRGASRVSTKCTFIYGLHYTHARRPSRSINTKASRTYGSIYRSLHRQRIRCTRGHAPLSHACRLSCLSVYVAA